jgi:thymidylate kinase
MNNLRFMKPSLFYVIGYPGSGKTTALRSVVKGLASRVEEKPFKHTLYESGMVQLGYEREAHGGTDSLPFNVQPRVVEWLQTATAPLIIGEGDRLANGVFFRFVQEQGRELTIVHLKVSELLSLRRMRERGSKFDPVWIRRTMSKVNNLVTIWCKDIVTIDGSKDEEATAAALTGIVYAGG